MTIDPWLPSSLPTRTVLAIPIAIGLLLTILLVVPMFLGSDLLLAGLALMVVAGSTLAAWWFRIERQQSPPALGLVARSALAGGTIAGLAAATREVAEVLGVGYPRATR